MPAVIFFYAKECPLSEACSLISWKKAQCWGYTEEECKAQVAKHLMGSGHRSLGKADAETWAESAEMVEDTYDEKESEDMLTRTRKRRAIASVPASVPEASAMASSSSGMVPATSSGFIYFRQHEFQAAVDCVNRAANAAGQAQRLAAQAARAFGDELAALNEVKANLETIQQGAGFFQ